jgi:hypothetical protein
MTHATWVCFDCREAVRRPSHTRPAVLCPLSGQPCRSIGDRIPLPLKRSNKAWEALRVSLQEQAIAAAECRHRNCVRQIHRIEREIARLETMPANEGHKRQVQLSCERLVQS